MIPNEDQSLAQGALAPWQKKSGGHLRPALLEGVARHLRIDMNTPWK